jgi:hypothetical protein
MRYRSIIVLALALLVAAVPGAMANNNYGHHSGHNNGGLFANNSNVRCHWHTFWFRGRLVSRWVCHDRRRCDDERHYRNRGWDGNHNNRRCDDDNDGRGHNRW